MSQFSYYSYVSPGVPENFLPEDKILLTGATSIHGFNLFQSLKRLIFHEKLIAIVPPGVNFSDNSVKVYSFCLSEREKLTALKNIFNPTIVFYCSGFCDLEACEANPERAEMINSEGAENVVKTFGNTAKIVFFSNDLIFSGNNPPPGGYKEVDTPNPLSVAGKTFLKAEKYIREAKNHLIFRTGLQLGHSFNFKIGAWDFIENRFRKNLPLTLFYDEIRSCISCKSISEISISACQKNLSGLYHLGGFRHESLFQLGIKILHEGGYDQSLLSTRSRLEEKKAIPRIGDVSLNSKKIETLLFLEN